MRSSPTCQITLRIARLNGCLEKLNLGYKLGSIDRVQAHGPGNVVFVEIDQRARYRGLHCVRPHGAKAEKVADEVVRQVRDYLTTDVPVGPYLADQIMLPLGISAWQADGGNRQRVGSFRTLPLTRHSTTHIEILRQFLGIDIRVERSEEGNTCKVTILP